MRKFKVSKQVIETLLDLFFHGFFDSLNVFDIFIDLIWKPSLVKFQCNYFFDMRLFKRYLTLLKISYESISLIIDDGNDQWDIIFFHRLRWYLLLLKLLRWRLFIEFEKLLKNFKELLVLSVNLILQNSGDLLNIALAYSLVKRSLEIFFHFCKRNRSSLKYWFKKRV